MNSDLRTILRFILVLLILCAATITVIPLLLLFIDSYEEWEGSTLSKLINLI